MKYIDEENIFSLIADTQTPDRASVEKVLKKALELKRLTLRESAILLNTEDPKALDAIYACASYVKQSIYGKRIVLFVPLYINNLCSNDCKYCAFRVDNPKLTRVSLTEKEVKQQVEWLLARGHKRVLMVAGEANFFESNARYYVRMMNAIYAVKSGLHYIRRVNVNCAPLSTEGFKLLKNAGIGTYQLFQETYNDATYRAMHTRGAKADPDRRMRALESAFRAGIDDLGMGVLYGLFDHKFETLALLTHIEHLEKKYYVGPHTISVPRLEPAIGSDIYRTTKYKVSDRDFKKLVAVLRLSVPYAGLILSTRESSSLRDRLFTLGISQISAESRTAPGAYSDDSTRNGQFAVGDKRNLDEVVASLIRHNFIPSFCAACYRKRRTGERFMSLARPGTIKGKCNINAIITCKEYLDDFASGSVKKLGYDLLEKEKNCLDMKSKNILEGMECDINRGARDKYV